MPTCIIPGCTEDADHHFGVRLRFPPQSDADWAPNTNAYLCDEHARGGAKITVLFEATQTGKVETAVYGVGPPIVRRTSIS